MPFRMRGSAAAVSLLGFGVVLAGFSGAANAQDDPQMRQLGRKYKAPPATSHIEITVLRGVNGKPIMNAGVVLRPSKDGEDEGNMEVKTGEDGKASIDVIPTGSYVRLQVIAPGYATYGGSFVAEGPNISQVIRMVPPKDQVSHYGEHVKGVDAKTGVQEPERPAPSTTTGKLAPGAPVISLGDAKGPEGSISGHVTDLSGAPIGKAMVTITLADGAKPPITLRSTDDGRYALVHLPVGKYTVRIASDEWNTMMEKQVVLSQNQSLVVDAKLKIGPGARK